MRLIRLLKKDLAREITAWVEQDLISKEQGKSIGQVYGMDYESPQSRSFGYNLLVALGYLFIGLAVITLLGANWDDIPRALRMAGLVAITLGTHALALRALHKDNQSAATGLFLLGNLFYGAAIILIAQIYHLGEHMPDGVFWWALGSLPMGVLLRNSWLTLFSCLLGLLWCALQYSLGYFAWLFPVFIGAGIYVLVTGRHSTLLFITVVASIGLWLETCLSFIWASERYGLHFHAEHVAVSVALFVFAYGFSHWLHARESNKARDYGVILSLWTLRFALIAMLIMSFEDPWRELIGASWFHFTSMVPMVAGVLAASVWMAWKNNKLMPMLPIAAFYALTIVAVVLADDRSLAVYFQVAYNLALVVAGVWLIVRGIDDGISHYFFLGVAAILLVAFMRYIDLIGDYIGGAVLFAVLAAFLLGAAKYWKRRQLPEVSA